MKRELIEKKRKILKMITVREYRELLEFIEDIYLSEYQLKIMLARKSSNLFQALIDLAKEEDGGRIRKLYEKKFAADKRPIIISDRALQYYAEEIRKGTYESILIIDDIIIHGRSIARLYEEIDHLIGTKKVNVDICALVANGKDYLNKPYLKSAKTFKNMAHHEWCCLSSMIIDLFYITGEPYTSYIPNIKISLNSSEGHCVRDFLRSENVSKLNDSNYSYVNVDAYAWISPDVWEFSLFQSVRFYINKDLDQCVMVPMVSLAAIDEEVLLEYHEILQGLFCNEYKKKHVNGCDELSYRAIIYVISSLWARLFFAKELKYAVKLKNFEDMYEEELNFGTLILDREKIENLQAMEISALLTKINDIYIKKEMVNLEIMSLQEDFSILDEVFKLAVEQTKNPIAHIGSFLYKNGQIDELLWRNYKEKGEGTSTRLVGYPLKMVIEKLKKQTASMKEIGFSILSAIDYGKGSIVAKMIKSDSGKCNFISLIHAGEQNYKYIEMKYFPYIYGLYEIERICKAQNINVNEYKLKFENEYKGYMEQNQMEYISEELAELRDTSISDMFESVLLRDSQSFSDIGKLNDAITLVDKIVNSKDSVGV